MKTTQHISVSLFDSIGAKAAVAVIASLILVSCDFSLSPSSQAPADYASLRIEMIGSQLAQAGAAEAEIRLSKFKDNGSVREEIEPVKFKITGNDVDVIFENLAVGRKKIEIYLIDSNKNQLGFLIKEIQVNPGENKLPNDAVIVMTKYPTANSETDSDGTNGSGTGAGGNTDAGGSGGSGGQGSGSENYFEANFQVSVSLIDSNAVDKITYFDVSNWIEEDCTSCHNATAQEGGIDLTRFPFLYNGQVPDVGFDLNQKVVDSLTGAYGVTLMPAPEDRSTPVVEWSVDKIKVMQAWSENEFARTPVRSTEYIFQDEVGTVRLLLTIKTADGRVREEALSLATSSDQESVFLEKLGDIEAGANLSGKLQVFSPAGGKIYESLIEPKSIEKTTAIFMSVKISLSRP